jgi:predicted nucleotidyltransferase
MTIKQIVIDRRLAILHIASRHGARNVRIFGSFARKEIDVVTENGLRERIRNSVLKEAIPL